MTHITAVKLVTSLAECIKLLQDSFYHVGNFAQAGQGKPSNFALRLNGLIQLSIQIIHHRV